MGIHSDANWCEVQIQFTASHFRAEQVDSSTVTFSMFWHIACVPYDIMRSPLWTVSFLSNSLCCDLHTRVLGPSHSIAKASTEIVIRAGCQALEEDLRNLGMQRIATPAMRCLSIPDVKEHLDALRLPSDYPWWDSTGCTLMHLVAPHLSCKQSPKCSRETKAPSCNQVPKAKAIWNQSNDITRMMQWFNVPNLEVFWGLETGILLGSCWDLFGNVLDRCEVDKWRISDDKWW